MSKKITCVISSIFVFSVIVILMHHTAFAEEAIFLDLPIGIKIGDSANIDSGLIMTLLEVQDSRCPSDVTCVWQGTVTAKIKLEKEGENFGTYEIPIETMIENKQLFEGYYIRLTNVEPYPVSSNPIKDENYSLTFIVSSAEVKQYVSPLKQYKDGVSFKDIKCRKSLQLTQKYDGTPACVSMNTYFELIKRNWVSNIIKAVQSRDFLDVDPTSSHIEKITPTLEDFKETLSKSKDIETIFSKFGIPDNDIGSGIHIYVYELDDFTQVWIGYTDHIWYIQHVDSVGNILENLIEENEN